jgi:ATP-dependent DNA helicase DinG
MQGLNPELSFDLATETRQIFGPGGLLSQKLGGYDPRPGQRQMAAAIADILQEEDPWGHTPVFGKKLAIEAETGIGKTLAYLIPATLSGQKIVVSTGTINLQEQILHKEIPFIREHIDPTLTALCVKGRQNYLCYYRYHQFTASPQAPLFQDLRLDALEAWLQKTETGDRAELDWLPDQSPLWREISATTSQCLGSNCPDYTPCFVSRLRKEAGKARLLIVNHHLFFSDLALRRDGFAEVLPRYESVIFDEAHHLENVATRYFGIGLSHYQFLDLARDIEQAHADSVGDKGQEKALTLALSLSQQAQRLVSLFPQDKGRFPLHDFINGNDEWYRESELLAGALVNLAAQLEAVALRYESWTAFVRRTAEAAAALEHFTAPPDPSYVYWYERRDKTVSLTASPIDIAKDLHKSFYNTVKASIFTSATLTTGATFSYFFGRLGLGDDTRTLQLPTPFDYPNRTRLYVPANGFPLPSDRDFLTAMQEEILQLLLASSGRALVLFTSIRAMDHMFNFLGDRLPFPVFVQGEAPKQKLLENFRNDTHSVLLAVASFWEGVDVPGDTLSAVIIDKLPFEVPSDPVIMARAEKIKEAGGNAFFDFQVPRAILTLRQGLGRLMRSASDQGLLAVLDARLYAKSYGRLFLKSTPPSPIIRSLDEVRAFFKATAAQDPLD